MLKPTLNLNFAESKKLDSRITFNRASEGSYHDSDGLVKFAKTNEPRFDHDPNTRESLGLLIEKGISSTTPNSCNQECYTSVLNTTKYSSNTIQSPDGSYRSGLFVDTTLTNSTHYISSGSSVSPQVTTSATIYVKHAFGDKNISFAVGNAANFANRFWVVLTPTGTFSAGTTGNGLLYSYDVEVLQSGWTRITMTGKADTAGTSQLVRCFMVADMAPASSYTGTAKNSWAYWGLQVEETDIPSSLIQSTESFTSRGSTATYYGSDGLIKSAATNTARYSYNPTNLSIAPSLLLESSSSNTAYSADFSASTNHTGTSISSTNNTSPMGDATASLLVENTANGGHYITRSPSITSGTSAYTYSLFVKQYGTTRPIISMQVWNPGATDIVQIDFNFETGTFQNPVLLGGGWQIYNAQKLPNGWWRISQTFMLGTTDTTCVTRLHLRHPTNGLVYTGDGTSGVYVWGHQFEPGYTTTSYIPTASALVTRSADVWSSTAGTRASDIVYMPSIADWYNVAEGTFVYEYYKKKHSSVNSLYLAQLTTNRALTSPDRLQMTVGNTNKATLSVLEGGIGLIASITGGLGEVRLTDDSNKIAYRIKAGSFSFAVNGDSGTISAQFGRPPVSMMSIGANITGADTFLNGHMKHMRFYSYGMSNAELEKITS